jgi:ABC-type lipoprotein release transport system permease subunit
MKGPFDIRLLLTLSWRSLWRNRRRTLITVSSIAFGTALALFLISWTDGMYRKLIDNAVRMNAGHVTVERREYSLAPSVSLAVPSVARIRDMAAGLDSVNGIKPLVLGQAMVATGRGSAGVGLTGVDPAVEKAVSPIALSITSGRYLEASDERGIVIGRTLARRLDVEPGMKVVVTCNDSTGELVNEMLVVTGVFSSGMEEADGFLIQVPIAAARRIFRLGPDAATQVGLILASPERQASVVARMNARLEGTGLTALPWQEVLPDLASFMTVDKGSNYVFQGIIIFLLSFTILNTILMSVLERTREFATLLAIGTSPMLLRAQVMTESALIGLMGTGLGLAIGGGISFYFQIHGLDISPLIGENLTVTGFSVDPIMRNQVSVRLLAWLGSLVFGLTLATGIYPAYRSAHIRLPDVLRSR